MGRREELGLRGI
jgi:hypothetical protein